MIQRGSVLIASVWALSIFSIFISSLSARGAQHVLLMKREVENLETKIDFVSAVHLTEQLIFSDPQPHEDSALDEWYGEPEIPDPWRHKISISVTDEESKLNLNNASEKWMKAFIKLFEDTIVPLDGEGKDLINQILKARQAGRIGSLEELYLFEGVKGGDVDKLWPYVTVYSEAHQVNINTVSPLVLKALLQSLPGDDRAREELFNKILDFRKSEESGQKQAFVSEELVPNIFLSRLKLNPSIEMLSLVNGFLLFVTTDSKTYFLNVKSQSGKIAETVMKERGDVQGMQILRWHEE